MKSYFSKQERFEKERALAVCLAKLFSDELTINVSPGELDDEVNVVMSYRNARSQTTVKYQVIDMIILDTGNMIERLFNSMLWDLADQLWKKRPPVKKLLDND